MGFLRWLNPNTRLALVDQRARSFGFWICLSLGCLPLASTHYGQEASTIFAGDRNWLAISNNGLWAWGANQAAGKIGGIATQGEDANTNLFLTYRVGGETNWRFITGMRESNATTFAIRTDGSLWSWGSNNLGQLGDGTGLDSKVPVRVGTDSNWKSISPADGKVFGLKTDGTLWAWGENRLNTGGLGIGRGRDTKQYLPVQIGQATAWASVTASSSNQWFFPAGLSFNLRLEPHTAFLPLVLTSVEFKNDTFWKSGGGAAVGSNGQLWSWGTTLDLVTNGIGSPASITSVATNFHPARFGADSGWKSVVFGPRPYALKQNGTLWQYIYTAATNVFPDPWGLNFTNVFRFRYVGEFRRIHGESATNWATLSALHYEGPNFGSHGYHTNESGEVDVFYFSGHVLGLKQDGTLWAWGNNARGQLGIGTTDRHIVPQQVGVDTNWVEASAGPYWSLGKKADGSVWAWGDIGGTADPYVRVPTRVGSDNDWRTAVAGSDYSLAVKTDGRVFACGQTEASPSVQTNFSPIQTGGTNRTDSIWNETGWTNGVAAYRRKMVAIETNGDLRIWGDAFGDYPWDDRTNPVKIPDDLDTSRPWWDPERYEPGVLTLAGPWVSVTGNSGTTEEGSRADGNTLPAGFAAAVRGNGTLWAWGANTNGQLGDGTRIPKDLPVQIGEGTNWLKVEAGGGHMLALQKDGSVWAWGGNKKGQLGSKVSNRIFLGTFSNLLSSELEIKTDTRYAPVRIITNTNRTFRATSFYYQSTEFDTNVVEPKQILPDSWGGRGISAGGANSLILRSDGTLWQLGNWPSKSKPIVLPSPKIGPIAVRTNLVTNIKVAPPRVLTNLYYQVPGAVFTNDDLTYEHRLRNVTTNGWRWRNNQDSFSAGDLHNLAVREDGTLCSWGENDSAQLGNGNLTGTSQPTAVVAGNRWRKVFAGVKHSLAIKDDGSLWAWGLNDGRLGLPFASVQTYYLPTRINFGPGGLATLTVENGQTGAKRISGSGLAAFLPSMGASIFSAQLTDGLLGSSRLPWEGAGQYSFLGSRLVFSNAYLSFLVTNVSTANIVSTGETSTNSIPREAFVRLEWKTLDRSPTHPSLFQGEAKYVWENASEYDRLKPRNGTTCRISFLFDQDRDGDGVPDMADSAFQGNPPVMTSTNRLNLAVGRTNGLPYRVTANSDTNSGPLVLLANEDLSALPPGLFYTTNGFDGLPEDSAVGRWEIVVGAKNDAGESYQTVLLNVLPPPPAITSPDSTLWRQGSSVFEYQITSSNDAYPGHPVKYSAGNLPSGISVNSTNGWIRPTRAGQSNVPAPGLYRWSLVASNAAGVDTNTLLVSVESPGTGEWTAGVPLAYAVNFGSGTTYTISGLPLGLTFNSSSGLISGTPLAAGTNEVTIVSRTRTGTNTNRILFPIRLGRPEIIGFNNTNFTGSNSLRRNEFFRYQISARSAGQPWAGASEFSLPLAAFWTNALGFRGTLNASSGTLRYSWTNTNSAYASTDWSQPLPLDTAWQVSVQAAFSTNNLGFLQNQQYLTAMLLALRDRSTGSAATNFISVYLEGSTNATNGEVLAEAVVDGVTNGAASSPAIQGRSALAFRYDPSDHSAVAQADQGGTHPVWNPFQTNSLAAWTNSAGSNSVILRLMSQSMAGTNRAAPFPAFSRFVVAPLGQLTYSSTNLPAGLSVDAETGLIYGTPTVATNLQISSVVISNSTGVTNLAIRFRIQ